MTPLGRLLAQVACVAAADAEHLHRYGVAARSSSMDPLVDRTHTGEPIRPEVLAERERLDALACLLWKRAREEGVGNVGTDALFGEE